MQGLIWDYRIEQHLFYANPSPKGINTYRVFSIPLKKILAVKRECAGRGGFHVNLRHRPVTVTSRGNWTFDFCNN
jgi:hypothetical protein